LGSSSFKATLFGQPENWSLGQLSDANRNVREEFSDRLGRVLHDLDIGKALAPSPIKFTDKIIDSAELTKMVAVGNRVLYRNPDSPADGVPLKPGEAYVISPSSCPITLMVRKDKALALHTGRDCLVDKHQREHGKLALGRRHTSICFSALEYLGAPYETQVKILWSIPGPLFKHGLKDPTHGKTNEALYNIIGERWGYESIPKHDEIFYLDLPKLIKAQCLKWGVPEESIDLTHAYHQPKGTWLEGKKDTPRNLLVLARQS
jgi:hypothetical protein